MYDINCQEKYLMKVNDKFVLIVKNNKIVKQLDQIRNQANENQIEERNEATVVKEQRNEEKKEKEQRNEENKAKEQRNEGKNTKEQRNKVNEANETSVENSNQKERETPEQNSSKGTSEGSQVQKCSVSFETSPKNGSLEASRERSGSGGSSISSNGSSGSSNKSSGSSNGSSKKVVVVRSAPITIGKVKLLNTHIQRKSPFCGHMQFLKLFLL